MESADNNSVCLDNCMNCKKKECSLLFDLHLSELKILNNNRYSVSFNRGDIIFKEDTQSTALIALNSGKVKIIRRTEKGDSVIVDLKKPVDFIGLNAFISQRNYASTAIALEDCQVCFINRDNFFELLKNNFKLTERLFKQLSNEIDVAQQRAVNFTQKHLRGKIADAILKVKNTYGISALDNSIDASLTRSDYASLSNMTTANAIRVLSNFRKAGIIKIDKRKITVIDINELIRISLND